MAGVQRITVNGSPMDIYLDHPAGAGPWPAVVLTYHREGIDDFSKWIARQYAERGYLVAVPEIAHRISASVPVHDHKALLKDSEIVDDIRATVTYLKSRPDVAGDRIAIAGHCMGGHIEFVAACAIPDFRGVIACYPTSMFDGWGDTPPPFAQLSALKCPVIAFFGDEDKSVTPADADRIDAEMTRLGIKHTFHLYEGVGHGFQRPSRDTPPYRAAQKDSWERTFAFLKANVG